MPIDKYYGGHGDEVMSDMQDKHGAKKGKQIFYATANKKHQNPETSKKHGSLNDIVFHEEAAQRDTVMNGETVAHPIHKGYDSVVFGDIEGWPEDGDEPKGSDMSANRDNGYGVHYGAPVDYFGPDTDYRAEEIDMTQYGKDYDPIPLRDYFKTEDKMYERTFRVRAQDLYDETVTPGTVTDSQPQTEAYGAVNYQGAGPSKDDGDKAGSCDYRAFKQQRMFARTNKDRSEEYAVDVADLDTKYGEDIK
jgi:hypothetical protein